MKLFTILSMGLVVGLTGCSSMTISYDASGQVIGSCKATHGFLSLASASCTGHSNGTSVNYNEIDKSTGLLPILPQSNSISIR